MKKSRRTTALTTAGITLLAGAFFAPTSPVIATPETQQADPATTVVADGLTSQTAAASCFEIKQNNPDSKSGAYWLYTPQMSAPTQFYCDQETDGGGWVLTGRGREGWTEKSFGQGAAKDIALNPDGTDAFAPAQLPTNTVNALLGGKTISEVLPQGVRYHRALNSSGTEWQDLYANRQNSQHWSWTFSAASIWTGLSQTSMRWYGSETTNLGMSVGSIGTYDKTFNAVHFEGMASQDWKQGFAYGSDVYGKDSASSYIWSKNNGGYGIPFTQVYIRPKLTQNDLSFDTVADAGTLASNRRALPNSYSEKVLWRTSEQQGTGKKSEMNTYVQAITQVGDTVFLGGDYAYVESATTGEKVAQKFLTGYDVNSGELVRTFMPKFNGQVKSLEALPNGLLAVGGEFTKVNDQPVAGLVLLDPATGAINNDWKWTIENRLSGGSPVQVKSLDVQGDYLYVAGSFTHTTSANNKYYVYARNALRFKLTDGSVDSTWTPSFNGTINGINASEDGQSVYMAGYFTSLLSKNVATDRLAALRADNADVVGNWTWESTYKEDTRPNAGFQFDVQDAGDTIYAGGSEHLIAQYDRNTFERRSASTTYSGGDFQDLYRDGDTIYGACHCGEWIYQGSGSDHKHPWQKSTQIDSIKLVGAFDRATGQYLEEFNPQLKGASGWGVWESFVDTNGVLWVGGDINTSDGVAGPQKTVGFARFAPRDVTAPATPQNLAIENKDGKDVLTWTPSEEQGVKYHVIRNNRVIATVDEPRFEIEHQTDARYYVRAVDSSENYSASTSAVHAVEPTPEPSATPEPSESAETATASDPSESAQPEESESATPSKDATASAEATETPTAEASVEPTAEEPVSEDVVSSGDDWSYRLADKAAGVTWNQVNTAAEGWNTGATPLGWGNFGEGTAIDRGAALPSAFYARKEVDLKDLQQAQSLTISTYADDGIAIYVNGKLVKKQNLSSSRLTYYTMADWWVDTADAQKQPVTVEIPASDLVEGKNIIAVEVHGAYRTSPNVSFDLSAKLNR